MIEFFGLHALVSALVILLACKEDERRIIPDEESNTFTNPLLASGPDP